MDSFGEKTLPNGKDVVFDFRSMIGCLGFSFYWGWNLLTYFSAVVLLPTPASLHVEPGFRAIAFFSATLGFLVLLLFIRKPFKKIFRIFIALIPLFFTPPIYILAFLTRNISSAAEIPFPLEILVWFLFGISTVCLLLQGGFYFASIPMVSSLIYMAVAVSLGSIYYLLIINMYFGAALIVTACMPWISTLAFRVARVMPEKEYAINDADPKKRWHLDTWQSLPSQFLYSIAFGFAVNVGISTGVTEVGHFSVIAMAFCSSGFLFLVRILFKKNIDSESTQWFLLPLIAIGLLPLVFFDNPMIVMFCCAILVICFIWYDMMYILVLSDLMREQPFTALPIFCAGQFIVSSGTFIGWTAGSVLLANGGYQGLAFNLTVMAIILCLIAILAFAGRPNLRNETKTIVVERNTEKYVGKWKQHCQRICQEVQLSPRQTEVFMLLVRGRNAKVIEEELFISNHTAKTHIYRIYQKLGVHTQQELIDTAEAYFHAHRDSEETH
ncbi:MAG: helix-turn-helix transcriptional regulator [Raoultibacter sp.]